VRHKNISLHASGDLFIVNTCCKLAAWLFPEFKYKWLADELKLYLPVDKEINIEGKNADKIRELYKRDPNIIVIFNFYFVY